MPVADSQFKRLKGYIDYKFSAFEKTFNEKINLLPTKDEFLTHMDRLYTQLNRMEQELTFTTSRARDNTDRIEVLEQDVTTIQKHLQI